MYFGMDNLDDSFSVYYAICFMPFDVIHPLDQ